jgi:hypothetical protein
MVGKYYVLLTISLLSILAFSITVTPIDASKSQGTPVSTINSKQVCGDSLCSVPMSISEKITMFFENNLKSDDLMEYDDNMFFQQGVSSASQGAITESVVSKSNYMSDMKKFLAISKTISMKNKEIVFDTLKSKLSFSSVSSQLSKITELKKSSSAKPEMDLSKISQKTSLGTQKAMMLSENIPVFNLDKKINIDAKTMKLKLKDLSGTNLQINEKLTDSKFLDLINQFQDKKITIHKVK